MNSRNQNNKTINSNNYSVNSIQISEYQLPAINPRMLQSPSGSKNVKDQKQPLQLTDPFLIGKKS